MLACLIQVDQFPSVIQNNLFFIHFNLRVCRRLIFRNCCFSKVSFFRFTSMLLDRLSDRLDECGLHNLLLTISWDSVGKDLH